MMTFVFSRQLLRLRRWRVWHQIKINAMKDWQISRRWILAAVIVLVAMMAPILVNHYRVFTTTDAEYAEHYGAFVGGCFGSVFAFVSVCLLFAALKSQQSAAAEQNLANAREHFETKYFELLRMHRDNVQEIGLKGSSGRKVFVLILRELREAQKVVKAVAMEANASLNEEQLQLVAYNCLFYGVGPNSSRMLKISLSDYDRKFIDLLEAVLNNEKTKEDVRTRRNFSYVPFEGHQSRLGHYYRHLFQMVRYVDEQPDELIPDKYKYVKTIRAQLSTHEQALLLINSLTPMGKKWWKMGFIVRYKLVKNIPHMFFDGAVEHDPCGKLPRGYFEWEE